MTKSNDIETQDLIDLGAASVETRGGQFAPDPDNLIVTQAREPGLSND